MDVIELCYQRRFRQRNMDMLSGDILLHAGVIMDEIKISQLQRLNKHEHRFRKKENVIEAFHKLFGNLARRLLERNKKAAPSLLPQCCGLLCRLVRDARQNKAHALVALYFPSARLKEIGMCGPQPMIHQGIELAGRLLHPRREKLTGTIFQLGSLRNERLRKRARFVGHMI